MDKFLKIFDVVFLLVFVTYVLTFVASLFSLIIIDGTFMACAALFVGVLISIRGFSKTRLFCGSRTLQWPPRYIGVFFASGFITSGIGSLSGQPMLTWAVVILPTICLVPLAIKELRQQ